jgi:phosphoglycerate dehydrogenase-like enzyme
MENVTLLPHIGGVAVETYEVFEKLCMDNIISVLSGKGPITPINSKFVESSKH